MAGAIGPRDFVIASPLRCRGRRLNGSLLVARSAMVERTRTSGSARTGRASIVGRGIMPPTVQTGIMLVVAVIGLLGNLITIRLLHNHHKENLNVKGAFLHMVGDTLSSVGVIAGVEGVAVVHGRRS